MRRMCLLVVLLGACATAERPGFNGGPDAGTPGADAPVSTIDAPPAVDAPPSGPQPITFSQNNNTTPIAANSIACSQGTTSYTQENSYYRVFALSDHGIVNPLNVESVTFTVETADGAGGATTQPAQLKLGTYNGIPGGTLSLASITPLTSVAITIPDGDLTSVTVPIVATAPAGSQLVVELAIPDGTGNGTIFFLGSNNAGETKPGYIRAPSAGCDLTSPTDVNAVVANAPDYIFVVNGTH